MNGNGCDLVSHAACVRNASFHLRPRNFVFQSRCKLAFDLPQYEGNLLEADIFLDFSKKEASPMGIGSHVCRRYMPFEMLAVQARSVGI